MNRACLLIIPLLVLACGGPGGLAGDLPGTDDLDPMKPIPETPDYDALGSGTLVFDRGGVIQVIDVDMRRTYACCMGSAPTVSPDGRQVAFMDIEFDAAHPDAFWDPMVATLHDGSQRRLATMQMNQQAPSWSTDGSTVIVMHPPEESAYYFSWIGISARTGDLLWKIGTPAFLPTDDSRGSMNADGVFVVSGQSVPDPGSTRSASRLMRFPQGKPMSMLVEAPEGSSLTSPAWSPDGAHVAYWELRRPTWTLPDSAYLRIVSADGRPVRTVAAVAPYQGATHGRGLYSAAWAPDGERLAYTFHDGEITAHVWVVGADGTGRVQITTAPDASDYNVSWGL